MEEEQNRLKWENKDLRTRLTCAETLRRQNGATTCRCCQATERKDQEVERSSYGSLLTHKCVHPYPATEKCPAECTASHRLEAAQTAAKGVLDYGRFCFHALEEEKEVKKITWDLRNIRAQRARAERYAADARAAYAAEQVKLHTHEIKSTVKMLDRVKCLGR
eukprot:g2054.t1